MKRSPRLIFSHKINHALGIQETLTVEGELRKVWITFEDYLIRHTKHLKYKLIIAFDEYENFHKNIATQHPQLLGYMRGFLQNQNQVIFAFIGLRDIAELTNPNWDEYFPQIQTFKVDYLPRDVAIELITKPTEDFHLIYSDDIVEEIYRLTQGHPQLLQTLCSLIVDRANQHNTNCITHDMLHEAESKLFDVNDRPMSIFYREYCNDVQREILEEILAGQPITQTTLPQRRGLKRLIEYGFITADYQIRVPLFERWLIEKRETIEISDPETRLGWRGEDIQGDDLYHSLESGNPALLEVPL